MTLELGLRNCQAAGVEVLRLLRQGVEILLKNGKTKTSQTTVCGSMRLIY